MEVWKVKVYSGTFYLNKITLHCVGQNFKDTARLTKSLDTIVKIMFETDTHCLCP